MRAIELAKQAGCDWVARTEKRLKLRKVAGLEGSSKKFVWKKLRDGSFIKVEA
jgi:predicted DNA-binding transcriptional regulator AlpA